MRLEKAKLSIVALATFTLLACSDRDNTGARADAERTYAATDAERVPADVDNTGRNVRDREGATLTPADQSNAESDIDLTQRIRQGITGNDEMSMQARNVKVITRDGVVTLRGPVKTEQEKASIEALARNAGAARVDNQLEIDRDIDPDEEY